MTVDCWIELAPRPDWCVGLDARSGRATLTLEEVRSRFAAASNRSVTVVWKSVTSARAGVISDHGEVAWNIHPADRIELGFSRPGKGPGSVRLVLGNPGRASQSLAFAAKYAPEYYAWVATLATSLAMALSVPLDERDDGVDA